QLASAQRRANRPDDALETLRAVLRIEPRSAAALNALGMVYESRGQHELADLVLHRALDIAESSRPSTSPAAQGRLDANGHPSDAKQAAEVWNNLGLVALARQHDQDAFADFD